MSLIIRHFYRFGDFTVDTDQKVLLRHGSPLPVTPKVFETLLILLESSGRIIEKEELMKRLWPNSFVEESNLTFNITQLRKSLGDSARHPQYVETVARRGYRFIAEVEEVLSDDVSTGRHTSHRFETSAPESPIGGSGKCNAPPAANHIFDLAPVNNDVAEPGAAIRSNKKLILSFAVAAAAFLMVVGWWFWRHTAARNTAPQTRLMLAVLPFKNLTGDTEQLYFSQGLTEEMITQLGNLDPQHVGVIARTSIMHYENSQEQVNQIARELGVQYLLEGSVRRDSDKVRITAQLIQASDQSPVWSREYDRELRSLLLLQREIAQEITDQIELTLEDNKRAEPINDLPLSPHEYEAYDLSLKGQYFWNKRTPQAFEQAIDYFHRATEKDPGYTRAYVGLANSYALIGGYSARPQKQFMEKARSAALRALEIDDKSAEAHTALALIVQNYDWDWNTAEKEFRRAIALNPNYATAHHWYAEHLAWRGNFDEALRESQQALVLDPLSLIIRTDNGAILFYSRQYDRAIEQFRAVLELDPTFLHADLILYAYVEKGLFAEAKANLEKHRSSLGDTPWYWSEYAYVNGRAGQREQAIHALEKLKELDRNAQVDASAFLWAYLGLGDKDQVFATLERACAQHSNVLMTLKVDPGFDGIRSDPRFVKLLARVGLDR